MSSVRFGNGILLHRGKTNEITKGTRAPSLIRQVGEAMNLDSVLNNQARGSRSKINHGLSIFILMNTTFRIFGRNAFFCLSTRVF